MTPTKQRDRIKRWYDNRRAPCQSMGEMPVPGEPIEQSLMAKSFFQIQLSETRKIRLVAAVIFLVYFGIFFAAFYSLVRVMETHPAHPVLKPLIAALALAMFLLVMQLWFADRHGVRVILEGLSAGDPDPDDNYHQRLARIVEEIGAAAGGVRARTVIVPTLAANAFALADSRQRVIGLTEGAVSRLTREQTQAVVAHEMAHIVNQDCRLATWTCAMAAPFVALADTLEQLEDQSTERGQEGGRGLSALAAAAKTLITLLTVALSRQRELRADAKAIELTRNPLALAEAIGRISQTDHYLGGSAEALSPIFVLPSRLSEIDEHEGLVADLFSSHPPVEKRLRILADMAHVNVDELAGRAARPQAAPPPALADQLAAAQKWMLRTAEGNWLGPFEPAQLVAQPGFGPQSWIRREGSRGDGEPACNDPLINRFLRRGPTKDELATAWLCPRCRAPLEKAVYEGLPIAKCPRCDGRLVAEKQVVRLLARREVRFSDEFLRRADAWLKEHGVAAGGPLRMKPEDVPDSCQCPLCGRPMMRRYYNYQYFIPIDLCLVCKQIWFDPKELELLQAIIERKQDRSPRPARLRP